MQAKGAGSVFSFITGSVALSKHLVETTKYFSIAVSFGETQRKLIFCFFWRSSNKLWDILDFDLFHFFSLTTGSVKSLISMPCFMSHASIPAEVREARGLTEDLVRISAGIEDADDLISDLDIAFNTCPL